MRDVEFYSRMVRMNGIVVFHDIVPGQPDVVGGVPELWRELRDSNDGKEFVHSWDQGGYGLGVIRKPGAYGDSIR